MPRHKRSKKDVSLKKITNEELEVLEDWVPIALGDKLQNGQYEILRKFGDGLDGTIWLVRDHNAECKRKSIQDDEDTWSIRNGLPRRARCVRTRYLARVTESISSENNDHHLTPLLDKFEHKGPIETHICLVTKVYGDHISSIRRSSPKSVLPVPIVKKVISDSIDALAKLHQLGIVHTDFKPINLLLKIDNSNEAVEKFLEETPVEFEGEYSIGKKTYQIFKKQPIREYPKAPENIESYLIDFGRAQFLNNKEFEIIDQEYWGAVALRSPETILESSFGPEIDIWTVGCIVFELPVGRWLFDPKETEEYSLEDEHFVRMMQFTGEQFKMSMLRDGKNTHRYFNEDGTKRTVRELEYYSIEMALSAYNVMPEDEFEPAADFIRTCIHLDPKDRPTAEELREHPWLKG
ncbi:kinase-like protein [Abortiporus biennis]|nr:kinase-like protein [Abortiporus biennis]